MIAARTFGGSLMAKRPKASMYVEIDADIKQRMDRLAAHRRRKLNGEVGIALERYLAEEEAKEPGLPPLSDTAPEEPAPKKRRK